MQKITKCPFEASSMVTVIEAGSSL